MAAMIAVVALAVAGCGTKSQSNGNTLTLTNDGFTTNSLTVKAGTAVQFVDGSGGATHFLTTGNNGAHADEAGAPSELTPANGMEIDAGQTKSITFATVGTYHITCTIHPTMNATIVVQQ